ncbi:MAG: hypothetical protein QOF92_600 [Pseudonocardiales bacterium]|nr:hypothetical protein [Pseudonocardiales bacterium]
MNPPAILKRHRALRWLAPVAVLGVGSFAATGLFQVTTTSASLPSTTPAALIAAVQSPKTSGFSGTVVSHLSLGLPELPAIGNVGGGTSMTSLLAGSHTLQVWYGGVDKQRIALLGATDEIDLFRTGRHLWQWSSADRVAVHTMLPKVEQRTTATPTPMPSNALSLTPSGLAQSALASLDPSTQVDINKDEDVADRSAYELVLTPRTTASRVGSVHISVDGKTKIPLGVQVYARGASSAAVDVEFTSIRFAQPSDTYFQFSPPSDAIVHQVTPQLPALYTFSTTPSRALADRGVSVTGSGWSTVVGYRAGSDVKLSGAFARALTPVSGSWGKGRLLESSLVCALVTDDGRVYTGAVDPEALYAAAGTK